MVALLAQENRVPDAPITSTLSLSERVSNLASTAASVSSGLVRDLQMIEMHVARAEAQLLRYEQKNASWTRPDLLTHVIETAGSIGPQNWATSWQ